MSLFAGAGGLDLGLENAGLTTVVANELEVHACETLRANQLLPSLAASEFESWFAEQAKQRCYESAPKTLVELRRRISGGRRHSYLRNARIIQGDIRKLGADDICSLSGIRRGELFMLAGGPPCQPFSRAGKRESVEVADGRLFLEFVRLVNELKPRWFLFENVKGLLLTRTDVVSGSCPSCNEIRIVTFDEREFHLRGDDCKPRCHVCGKSLAALRTSNERGGSLDIIVQEFERTGYSCAWRVLNAADFGAPQIRERLFLVGSRDNEPFSWPQPTHGETSSSDASQLSLFRGTQKLLPWRTMIDCLWPKKRHSIFGRLDPDKAVLWVKNVVRPHDEPVTWTLRRASPTIGAHQAAKLAIAPKGVPEAQLRRQQWHVLGKRQGDTPPVPVVHEYLSDEELLRLQTFPENWYLFGTRMQRAFQIGNAVPPILAQAVGEEILKASGIAHPGLKAVRNA